jgi:hypothetical protein
MYLNNMVVVNHRSNRSTSELRHRTAGPPPSTTADTPENSEPPSVAGAPPWTAAGPALTWPLTDHPPPPNFIFNYLLKYYYLNTVIKK